MEDGSISVFTSRSSRSTAHVDDGAASQFAPQDRVEGRSHVAKRHVVTDPCETPRLEVARHAAPHLSATLDGRLHRVDTEQGDTAQDERVHGRGQVGAPGETAGRHRPAVHRAAQDVSERDAAHAVDRTGPHHALERFAAGLSDYGIGDLEALAMHTHKFEARYLDRLVAPYPSGREVYQARSPLLHVDHIETPMLILQGEDDRVVPPDQARSMATALNRRGVPHTLVVFAGEGHGFRAATTITTVYATKLAFLGQVLGFVPAGDVGAVEIQHLAS